MYLSASRCLSLILSLFLARSALVALLDAALRAKPAEPADLALLGALYSRIHSFKQRK